jgi:hypothetical protein
MALPRLFLPLLLSLGACAAEPLGPSPTPPQTSATPSASPDAVEFFHRKYIVAHNQVPLGKNNPRLARLENGNIALVGAHALPQNGIGKLVLTLISAQGEALWSKHLELEPSFQLGGLMAHGNDLYIHGFIQPEGPRASEPNANLKHIGVLKVSAAGEIQWYKIFKIPPFSRAFNNYSQMIGLSANELALVYYDRVYLMDTQGIIRTGVSFPGRVYDVQHLPDDNYLVNHLKIDPGYTWVSPGFQLTVLNSDASVQWRKFYAGNLSGVFSLSRLHPVGNGRYHMSFGVNDRQARTRIGLGHVIVNPQGDVEQSFSELARTDGPEMFFTEIHQSLATSDAIYINASHGSGGVSPLQTLTFKYAFNGAFQGLRTNDEGDFVIDQQQLIRAFPQRPLLQRFAFELASSPFARGFCHNEIATLRRSDDFVVQVNDHTGEPTPLTLPTSTSGSATTVTLAVRGEKSVCPQ